MVHILIASILLSGGGRLAVAWVALGITASQVYSPITFGKKYDPEGKYVKHFLPVLKVRALFPNWQRQSSLSLLLCLS